MISLKFVLQAALLVLVFLCLQLIRRAGSGREIVRLRRRSRLDVESAWSNLQHAWQTTGLTFRPARIDVANDGVTYTILAEDGDEAGAVVVRALEPPTDRSVMFAMVSTHGHAVPEGLHLFDHWRIEPDGAGSRVIIETRFRSTVFGTLKTLWGLWRQAGIIASADAKRATVKSGSPPVTPQSRAAPNKQTLPRKARPTVLPSSYGREALISLFAFAYLLTQYDWRSAIVLAGVILWHEYGHLLAYRLTGRSGNRLMLVPFFGGMAVAGAPHKSEFERAFCALMGPAICAPLTLAAYGLWYFDIAPDYDFWFWSVFQFSALINLLNLLPIYPLDGGQAAESFLRSFFGSSVFIHLSGLSVAGIAVLAGFKYYEMAIIIGLFSVMGLRSLPMQSRLPAMNNGQASIMALFYAATVATHGWVFLFG